MKDIPAEQRRLLAVVVEVRSRLRALLDGPAVGGMVWVPVHTVGVLADLLTQALKDRDPSEHRLRKKPEA